MCANFNSRIYTALQYTLLFAGPSRSVGFLHQFNVDIFWVSFPLTTLSSSPCIGATIVPCLKELQNVRKFPLTDLYGIAVRGGFCGHF